MRKSRNSKYTTESWILVLDEINLFLEPPFVILNCLFNCVCVFISVGKQGRGDESENSSLCVSRPKVLRHLGDQTV